jgi:hypothetical protein
MRGRAGPQVNNEEWDIAIPLSASFRFAHEPTGTFAEPEFVGRRDDVDRMLQRLLFSDGGSFLVTGYRGVGKTSFVNKVLAELQAGLIAARPVLGEVQLVAV